MATRPPIAAPPPELLGRDVELQAFEAALGDVSKGRGRLFLLEGEPGIGKTTLADVFCDLTTAEAGALVFWGRCWEGGDAPAYWPWTQVIREVLETAQGLEALTRLGPTAGPLGMLVPEIDPAGAPSPTDVSSEQARFALFDTVARLLRLVARATPITLVLDDLHAADLASGQLLHFIARDLRAIPCVIIATYRDAEARARGDLWEVLNDVRREGEVLHLAGLPTEAVSELIRRRTGVEPGETVAEEIERLTAGNPFFAHEIARLLLAEGRVSGGELDLTGLRLPELATVTVLRRVRSLRAETREVLDVASVIGPTFDLDVVADVLQRPHDEVLAFVHEAARENLLTGPAAAGGGAGFSHQLIREALYEALSEEHRVARHRAVASALERRGGDDSRRLAELAHHFDASAQLDDGRKAFEYALRAGEEALDRFAYEEAAARLRRALQLEVTAQPGPEARVEVRTLLGRALVRRGEAMEARGLFQAAADLVRTHDLRSLLPTTALAYGEIPIQAGFVDDQLIALHEDALQAAGGEESMTRAALMARLAYERQFSPSRLEIDRQRDLARQALAIARQAGSQEMLPRILRHAASVFVGPDTTEETLALYDEGIVVTQALRDREAEALFRARRCSLLLQLGRIDEFHADAEAVKRTAVELRHAELTWMSKVIDFTRAELRGEFDEAVRLRDEAAAMRDRVPTAFGGYIAQAFQLHLFTGGITDELIQMCRTVMEATPFLAPLWSSALAWADADTGNLEQARERVSALLGQIEGWPRNVSFMYALVLLAEAVESLRDGDLARGLYPHLEPFAGRHGYTITVVPSHYHGPIDYHLGVLAALAGETEAARRHFDDAARMAAEVRSRPALARVQAEQASLVREDGAGGRERALRLATEARDYLQGIGLERLARRAAAVVSAIEATAASGRSEDAGASLVREGEYWTVRFGGSVARIRHSKALAYLVHLLRAPEKELHVLELVAGVEGHVASGQTGNALDGIAEATGFEALDPSARAAYKARLRDLAEELDEAERFNDPVRADRARQEIDAIAAELARGLGLGGRSRRTGSPAEQARVNITKHLKRLQDRLRVAHPALADHLASTIRTGTFCSYVSGAERTVAWDVREGARTPLEGSA